MVQPQADIGDRQPSVACHCKVSDVAERYDLGTIAHRLKELWAIDGDEGHSLRELADYFNQEVLTSAMLDASMNPLEGEVENVYRLLMDADAGSGSRIEAERRLEREDISVEQIRDDFITHQTAYRHLKNCLDVEYQQESSEPYTRLKRDNKRIEELQNRTSIIVEEIVQRLTNAELISVGEFDVYNDVRIICEDCNSQYTPRELLEQRGCRCDTDDT